MNARERQIRELLDRRHCPVCGREAKLGDHDCEAPYTIRDAMARLENHDHDVGVILNETYEYEAKSGREVGRIGINEPTLRKIVKGIRSTTSLPIADSEPLTMWGRKVQIVDTLPDDVISFISELEPNAGDIIKGIVDDASDLAITDPLNPYNMPIVQSEAVPDDGIFAYSGQRVFVDDIELKDVKVTSFDFTRENAAAAGDNAFLRRYFMAGLDRDVTLNGVGRITGLTS